MAQIPPKLLAKITKRFDVSKSRIYALIQETAQTHNLPIATASLIVARDAGISINRFATPEDWVLIRGVHSPAIGIQQDPTSRVRAVPSSVSSRPNRGGRSRAPGKRKGNKVWVVYGRDEHRRKSLFDLLRAVGLQPIEWNTALAATKKGSPHIAEVLDAGFRIAVATVVLFTPDDEAKLKGELIKRTDESYERRLTGQPRPNVLFEAGMAFGRHPDQTILVTVGRTRPISDLVGRQLFGFPTRYLPVINYSLSSAPWVAR